MRELNDSENNTLLHALSVAADVFGKHAETARQAVNDGGRLADQFERQVRETRELYAVLSSHSVHVAA